LSMETSDILRASMENSDIPADAGFTDMDAGKPDYQQDGLLNMQPSDVNNSDFHQQGLLNLEPVVDNDLPPGWGAPIVIPSPVPMECPDDPKALRTPSVLQNIFSYLELADLLNADEVCKIWKNVITENEMWKKRLTVCAQCSKHNREVLNQHGFDKEFLEDNPVAESEHYRNVCQGWSTLISNWRDEDPLETLLYCEPADLNNQNFSWKPVWTDSYPGWICAFKFNDSHLVVGIIDTLQVWDLKSQRCTAILETPEDEIFEGVDIALNCLDIHDNIIVSGSNEGIIRVWEVEDSCYANKLDCIENGAVNSLKFHKQLLFSAHDDGPVMVWKVHSSTFIKRLKVFENHTNITWALDVNEQFLVSCSEDASVAVYDRKLPMEDWFAYKIATTDDTPGHTDSVTCVALQEICSSQEVATEPSSCGR